MAGGGQKSLLLLLSGLDRQIYHPLVVAPQEGEFTQRARDIGADVRVLSLPSLRGMDFLRILRTLRGLKAFLEHEKIALVHTDSPRASVFFGLAARSMGIPLIWHARVGSGDAGWYERFVYSVADQVIAVSSATARRFAGFPGAQEKVKVIYNAIDPQSFTAPVLPGTVRRELGVRDDHVLIGAVSQLIPGKGLEDLLVSAGIIAGQFPQARFLIVGDSADDYQGLLKSKVAASGLADKVIFTGFRRDIPEIMAAMDIFVLPTLFEEGLSRSMLEAMACGRPVVATHLGGNKELVEDGVTGVLVPAADPAGLAQALAGLIADKVRRESMGLKARQRIEREFNLREQVQKIEGLYNDWLPRPCPLCGKGRGRPVQRAEGAYRVIRCQGCSLVYVTPLPGIQGLNEHYDGGYYREWIEKQARPRMRLWNGRMRHIKKYKDAGRFLDVGCGVGTFLAAARGAGFEVSGTEVSAYACRHVKDTLGMDIVEGPLEAAGFPDACFDVVTLWHVLEHVPDPVVTLGEVRRVIKKDGLLVVAVPNVDNRIMKMLYRLVKGRRLPLFSANAKELHLTHFSTGTLTAALERAGFRVISRELDLSQLGFPKRVIDWLAGACWLVFRKNWGEAIKIYAEKS
jgi:glycosyltransferase involved in cell wall biosynthesis